MASALQLNEIAAINANQGLLVSANITSAISTYRSAPTVQAVYNMLSDAAAHPQSGSIVGSTLDAVASGLTQGHALIDACCVPISQNTANIGVGYFASTVSYSGTLTAYVNAFFYANSSVSLSLFSRIFGGCSSYCSRCQDHKASKGILSSTTYGTSGLGYTGPTDLATNGLGSKGRVLANVISTWGTMYDVKSLSNFYDPYVFGQNLLNQGFGTFGNLAVNLTAAGLNVTDLASLPSTSSLSQTSAGTTSITAFGVGAVDLPSLTTTTTQTDISGTNSVVVHNIYSQVTGTNLGAIVHATNVSGYGSSVSSLDDFTNFAKAIGPSNINSLASIGVKDFPALANILVKTAGSGSYASWTDLANFYNSIDVPRVMVQTNTVSSTSVLHSTTQTFVDTAYPNGTGPLNTVTMIDLLGTVSGITQEANMASLTTAVKSAGIGVLGSLNNLRTALKTYMTQYDAWLADITYGAQPSLAPVTAAQQTVITTINSLSSTVLAPVTKAQTASINNLNYEAYLLNQAGVQFTVGSSQELTSFAQNLPAAASDKLQFYTYPVIQNLTTHDSAGDDVRLAISEYINQSVLSQAGILTNNDPQPSVAINTASRLNTPLSTYLSQHK
jgi:hypothetical protein